MRKQFSRNGAIFSFALALVACGSDAPDSPALTDAGSHAPADSDASISDARVSTDARAESDASGDASATLGDGGCIAFVMPSGLDCSAPANSALPKDLRCTGLYGDFATKTPACGLLEFKPAYPLWSDGAEKRRWASIPSGTKIDASDPDAFVYPVGTRFWKEFRVKASDGRERMAETRLEQKTADGWIYTSYVWSEDETEATQMDNDVGVPNLYGTGHVVPTRDQCAECHNGRSDFVLGWDGVMLGAGAEGVTHEQLVSLGLVEPGSQLSLAIPGNAVERAALGYLHANCGISCHNGNPMAKGGDSGLHLRLEKDDLTSVATTDAFTSGINKRPGQNAKLGGLPAITGNWYDVRPGDPSRSLLVARQMLRGFEGQMPRIATTQVDDAGVQAVSAWIASMTVDAGYPKPAP
ncbi:MAG: hypothetical protein JWN48_3535 [Myxococcaceae bacterium]|nr:hypothetical protein [Myxococcaceae bacterium]